MLPIIAIALGAINWTRMNLMENKLVVIAEKLSAAEAALAAAVEKELADAAALQAQVDELKASLADAIVSPETVAIIASIEGKLAVSIARLASNDKVEESAPVEEPDPALN